MALAAVVVAVVVGYRFPAMGATARTPPVGWRQATIEMRPSAGDGLGVGARLPPAGLT